jgi:hypothetical protein
MRSPERGAKEGGSKRQQQVPMMLQEQGRVSIEKTRAVLKSRIARQKLPA